MKVRRLASALALVGALLAATASPATAADPCPPHLERVSATVPRYVNAGARFDLLTRQSHSVFEYVARDLFAEIAGAQLAVPLSEDSETATPLRAPVQPEPFAVAVRWEQVGSTQRPDAPACSARRELPVTVLSADAKIGDLDMPRVEGRWKVHLVPRGWPAGRRPVRMTTRFQPLCDVGGCDFLPPSRKVRWLLDGGRYRAVTRGDPIDCPITVRRGGEVRDITIEDAFAVQIVTTLRVVRQAVGADGLPRAVSLRGGDRKTLTPTRRARAQGCTKTFVARRQVSLDRL